MLSHFFVIKKYSGHTLLHILNIFQIVKSQLQSEERFYL